MTWSSSLSLAWNLLFVYILVPVFSSLRYLVLLLLRPIGYVLHSVIVLPLVKIVRFGRALIALPFAVLLKFETIIIYLTVAGAIGVVAGCILYATYTFIEHILGLKTTSDTALPSSTSYDPPREYKSPLQQERWDSSGRTIADYRASRENKKIQQQQLKKMPAIQPKISPREFDSNNSPLSPTTLSSLEMSDNSNVMYMNGREASTWPQKRGPLSSQTILEEDDSDSSF